MKDLLVQCVLLPLMRSVSEVHEIVAGVQICLWTKKFESYFSDRLTISNIHGRTSCRIYGLALSLCAPEMLSLSSKSRIFLYKTHLALFIQMEDTSYPHKCIGKYRHLVNWNYLVNWNN